MLYKTKLAKDLKVGDVLAANSSRGPISIKKVIRQIHPTLRTPQIKVMGPLNMVEKFDADVTVSLIRAV